jgi:nucleotide-binding universal stress UspA family protein
MSRIRIAHVAHGGEMKNVAYATDGSAAAKEALCVAEELCLDGAASLHVLAVTLPLPPVRSLSADLLERAGRTRSDSLAAVSTASFPDPLTGPIEAGASL